MSKPTLRCARCHRPLVRIAATVAGLPLGPDCARAMGAAMHAPVPLLQLATDRATAAQEAEFRQRQADLFQPATP